MKKGLKRGLIIYGIGFFAVLVIRLVYGYATYGDTTISTSGYFGYGLNAGNNNDQAGNSIAGISGWNKASEKRIVTKTGGTGTVTVEQKYEKVAHISSESSAFEKEQKRARDLISSFKAVIQYEQNSGLKGNRSLNLVIGVVPEKFDEFTDQIRGIGKLQSILINKTDKTSEYRDLNAKRKSLEESIESLIALKKRGGRVEEYIKLEEKILETKKQIQDLGVKLGDYAAENELCTVRFTLYEKAFYSYSFIRSLKISLVWAVQLYLVMTICAFFGGLTILIGLKIIEKTKLDLTVKKLLTGNTKRRK
jgi:hypothetical protein